MRRLRNLLWDNREWLFAGLGKALVMSVWDFLWETIRGD